uniref:Uncharacterized protein n=1 Tax=Mycena chlorophos TaxID=658473 RepID=A0ABQ0LVY7_MYCCL|nr:predicted protein [Mycena chlorophos]
MPPPTTEVQDLETAISDREREISMHRFPIADVNAAAPLFSTILSLALLAAGRPVDPNATSADVCKALLERESGILGLLAAVATPTDWRNVADSVLLPPPLSPQCRKYLEDIRASLVARVKSLLSPWRPKAASPAYADTDILQHLEALHLQTEEFTGTLKMILYDLGSFSEQAPHRERLSKLFTSPNKFLTNASATGKTRLCYEGLCANWGLYFTVKVDEVPGPLGSRDLERTIKALSFWGKIQLDKENPNSLQRQFGAVLLARLLLFSIFLGVATANGAALDPSHKLQWLQLQLNPRPLDELHRDCFVELKDLLVEHDADHLLHDVADALRRIRRVIGPDEDFFIVVDEAQEALQVSVVDTVREPEVVPKHLLGEILRSWTDLLGGDCTFVCAGIGIPATTVIPPSAVGAFVCEWTSDTGAFDDPVVYEAYVRKVLPPTLRDTRPFQLLVARMWRWLRGRHRITDAFLALLLTEGLDFPHKCLSNYIEVLTDLKPLDAVELEQAETLPKYWSWNADLNTLPAARARQDIRECVTELLYECMATHHTSLLGPEHAHLVNAAYGYFNDAALSTVVVDEPIPLVAAARAWFPFPEQAHPGDPVRHPATFISSLSFNPPRTSRSVAHCLVFYLAEVLGEPRPLTDVFQFSHPIPSWAKQTARLVRFYKADGNPEAQHTIVPRESFVSPLPLATACQSLDETARWLDHEYGTAFCVGASPKIDLFFALKLADDSFLWVGARTFATEEPIQAAELHPLVLDFAVESLFEDPQDSSKGKAIANKLQTLPGLKQRPSLLRAFCGYPAPPDLDQKVNLAATSGAPRLVNVVDARTRDVASLDLKRLRGRADQLMQDDFFCALVNGAIAGQKRKSQWDDGVLQMTRKRAKEIQRRGPDLVPNLQHADMEPRYWWDERDLVEPIEISALEPLAKPRGRRQTKTSRASQPSKSRAAGSAKKVHRALSLDSAGGPRTNTDTMSSPKRARKKQRSYQPVNALRTGLRILLRVIFRVFSSGIQRFHCATGPTGPRRGLVKHLETVNEDAPDGHLARDSGRQVATSSPEFCAPRPLARASTSRPAPSSILAGQ